MNLTKIIRPYFMRRMSAVSRWLHDPEKAQRAELARILSIGASCEWAKEHGLTTATTLNEFRNRCPVSPYEEIRSHVMRMVRGERDVLWPGQTRRFAQSSGTSDGKSKYIPVTDESLRRCHYRGGGDVVAHYLRLYPDSRIFSGKSFILGGSFANELNLEDKRVRIGDLSANLIESINPIANLVRIPKKEIALMTDWSQKLPALVNAAMSQNVTNISGVPSWFLTVLRKIIEAAGAESIHDVWPNLEVFFHGGIAFGPYHKQYDTICDPKKMRYLDTYNASEGFFAVQSDRDDTAMMLILDAGIFFEFIPLERADDTNPPTLSAWEVEKGRIYSLVITGVNGLWRYPIGDTVRIEQTDPLKITIAGRTKHFINAFGEELMVYNADRALAKTCSSLGCEIRDYTAAPVYADGARRGRHQWLIEFATPPCDLEKFADELDRNLMAENSDYQAKRSGNIFLDPPELTVASPGLFDRWLSSTGKLGGQRKVPRLSNDRRTIDAMLEMETKLI